MSRIQNVNNSKCKWAIQDHLFNKKPSGQIMVQRSPDNGSELKDPRMTFFVKSFPRTNKFQAGLWCRWIHIMFHKMCGESIIVHSWCTFLFSDDGTVFEIES